NTRECVAPRCPPEIQEIPLLSTHVTGPKVWAIVALGWSRSGSIAAPAQTSAPAISSAGVSALAMTPSSISRDDSERYGRDASPGAAANQTAAPVSACVCPIMIRSHPLSLREEPPRAVEKAEAARNARGAEELAAGRGKADGGAGERTRRPPRAARGGPWRAGAKRRPSRAGAVGTRP